MGRDTETSALVRCDAYPPDWSPREGSSELARWLLHTEQSRPAGTRLPTAPADARWLDRGSEHSLPWPGGWHVSQDKQT